MSVKSSVLTYLESQKSRYVSGEELAARLSCSRTAVWKAIQSLRQEGYTIKAVTNKGYLLEKDSGLLSADMISSYLNSPDIPVMVYKKVASTNLLLRQKALESASSLPGVPSLPDGSMVLAESQSAGRGHLGRGFFSPEKSGLYLSILYHPKALLAQSRLVTAAAAAAVWDAVHSVCGYDLDIKWVNDLYFQEKKVCGILTEASSSFETGEIDCIIIGIGLNLSEPDGGFPPSFGSDIGAITKDGCTPDGLPINRNRLAAAICSTFLQLADSPSVPEIYRSRSMILGRSVIITGPDGISQTVMPLSIENDGSLTCRTETGSICSFPYGNIRLTD